VDGDNGTELESVKRGRVSMKGCRPESVCKQGGGQREQVHYVSEGKEPGGGL